MLCIEPKSSTNPNALNRVISGAKSDTVRQYLRETAQEMYRT